MLLDLAQCVAGEGIDVVEDPGVFIGSEAIGQSLANRFKINEFIYLILKRTNVPYAIIKINSVEV